MNKEFSITPLFGIPIFNTKVDPISERSLNYIKNLSYERIDPAGNGFVSTNKYILDDAECKEIKEKVLKELNFYTSNVLEIQDNIDFKMTNSWAVKHLKNDWAQSHIHTNSLISGVLYLQTDEKSGKIVFGKEVNYQNLFPPAINIEYKNWNIFNSKSWSYRPENNQIIFFPSNIQHWVEKSESDIDRYCISFNFFPRGKLGKDVYFLEIN